MTTSDRKYQCHFILFFIGFGKYTSKKKTLPDTNNCINANK